MSYLEQSSRMLAEVGTNLVLQRGAIRGRSSSNTFFSAGSYQSEVMGNEVFVGVKENENEFLKDEFTERFIHELAIMNVIAQNLPHLLPNLPLFYGLLVDKTGEPIGIVSEDATENGKRYRVDRAQIPVDVKGLFLPDSVWEDHYKKIGETFWFDNYDDEGNEIPRPADTPKEVLKFIDFYPLVKWEKGAEHAEKFGEAAIAEDLSKYTMQIAYDL